MSLSTQRNAGREEWLFPSPSICSATARIVLRRSCLAEGDVTSMAGSGVLTMIREKSNRGARVDAVLALKEKDVADQEGE